jgi:hypothetical protein
MRPDGHVVGGTDDHGTAVTVLRVGAHRLSTERNVVSGMQLDQAAPGRAVGHDLAAALHVDVARHDEPNPGILPARATRCGDAVSVSAHEDPRGLEEKASVLHRQVVLRHVDFQRAARPLTARRAGRRRASVPSRVIDKEGGHANSTGPALALDATDAVRVEGMNRHAARP